MKQITRHYELRRFTDPNDPDFLSALRIYTNNVPAEARVDSNEITYWMTHSGKTHGDEFISFGFFADHKVAGYAQMTWLRKSRLIFFDYIVLDPAYRNLGEYFQFAGLLKAWILDARLEFDYLVGEVAFETTTSIPNKHCLRLVRLFKQMGFGVADCEYRYPPLNDHQAEAGLRAHLVLWSQTRIRAVTRTTMMHIANAIYFRHYAQWHEPFALGGDRYEAVLKELSSQFESTLQNKSDVPVNGIKLVLPPGPDPEPVDVRGNSIRNPLIVVVAIATLSVTFILLQMYVHTSTIEMVMILTCVLLIVATAFALCHKKSRGVLQDLLKFATGVFDKSK